MFRNVNKLLYNSRIMTINSRPYLGRLSVQNVTKRSHSLFWQRVGLDLARVRIKANPLSKLENGGWYSGYCIFMWFFCGMNYFWVYV